VQTQATTGVLGAKRESWRPASARALVKRFFDRFEDPSPDQVFEAVKENLDPRLRRGDRRAYEITWTALEHYVANTVRSLRREQPRIPAESIKERQAAAQTEAREILTKYEASVKIRLISMLMPNGKEFGDCTREELQSQDATLTKLHRGVLKLLKPGQTPREAGLTESKLRSLASADRSRRSRRSAAAASPRRKRAAR
jgi:hypothetical protein